MEGLEVWSRSGGEGISRIYYIEDPYFPLVLKGFPLVKLGFSLCNPLEVH